MNKCEIKVTARWKIYVQHAYSHFDNNSTFCHHTSAIVQYFKQHFESLQQF